MAQGDLVFGPDQAEAAREAADAGEKLAEMFEEVQQEREAAGDEERVNHPAHYGGGDNPYEAIKVIEALGWGEGFNRGNALKYLMRAGRKGDKAKEEEDIAKARWYVNREVERLSAGQNGSRLLLDFRRASGDTICPTCNSEYRRHPHDRRPEALGAGDTPYLRVLCNGERVKL